MKTELFPQINFYKTVTSTNSIALDLLHESKCADNFVICAKEQTNGRGRQARSWYSPVGGLYFTLGFPGKKFAASVTLFTGVVIHKVLQSVFPELTFSIKWPNDIFLNNKKVGGILTSTSDLGTVIGIGIDGNIKNIPERLEGIATSLLIESGKKISLKKMLKVFLNTFEYNFHIFEEKGFPYYRSYFEKVHSLAEKRVKVYSGKKEFEGFVFGVTDDGVLIIETEKRKQEILSAEKIDILG